MFAGAAVLCSLNLVFRLPAAADQPQQGCCEDPEQTAAEEENQEEEEEEPQQQQLWAEYSMHQHPSGWHNKQQSPEKKAKQGAEKPQQCQRSHAHQRTQQYGPAV
jgi:hypothetical protein